MEGWYYLHINGELIYKRELGGTAADIRESDFALALWPCDPSDREGAWRIVVEALAAGANPARIKELAAKWECTDEDAQVYAGRIGAKLLLDGNYWFATAGNFTNLQESKYGSGDTALDALANLAIALWYRGTKMWGATFKDLLKANA